jgi:hypothetical protein
LAIRLQVSQEFFGRCTAGNIYHRVTFE